MAQRHLSTPRAVGKLLRAAAVSAAVSAGFAPGADYVWDPNKTATTAGGGAGTWNTANVAGASWFSGAASTAWANGANNAVFGNGGGTVSLGMAVSATGIVFNGSGYTIAPTASNTLTLTSAGTGAASAIYTGGAGVADTVAGPLYFTGASASITVSAGDTLSLTGAIANSASGATTVIAGPGTATFTGTSLSTPKLNVQGGATFSNFGSITGTTASVGVSGTAASAWTISGGTTTVTTGIYLGDGQANNGDGRGTLVVAGGTLTTGSGAGEILIGNGKGGVGRLDLNGGTLGTNFAIGVGTSSVGAATGGSGTINFNGGTLQATGNTLAISGLTAANVRDGGAVIDTAAYGFSIVQNLLHSTLAGDKTTDGGLTKSGVGTLTLSGANTYTGVTNILGGGIYLGSSVATFGKGAVSTAAGTFAGTNTGNAVTISNAINGDGGFTQNGTGTTTLAGTNAYTGPTNVNQGTVAINSATGLGNTTAVNLGSNALTGTLKFTGSTAVATAVPIRMAGSTGGASLDASGTGAFTVNSAIAQSVAGAKTFTLTGTSTAANTLNTVLADNTVGVNGTLSLVKSGTGLWVLGKASTYTGSTTISGGTLSLGTAVQPLGVGGTIMFASGGALQFTAANQIDYSSRFSTAGGQAFGFDTNGQTVTLAGPLVSTTGTLTKSGSGTLILTNSSSTYASTLISDGTLQLGNNTAATPGGMTGTGPIVDNAALLLNRNAAWTFATPVSGTGTMTQAGGGAAAITGVLSHGGGLTVGGGGATLSAANTYGGTTLVNAALDVTASNTALGAAGAGNGTTINGGGTLRVRDASLDIPESFVLNGGAFVVTNAPATVFTGPYTLNVTATIQIQPSSATNTTTLLAGNIVEGGVGSDITFVRNGANPSAASTDVVQLTGVATHGGNTTVTDSLANAGLFSLQLAGGNNRLPVGTTVYLNAARLTLGDAATGAVNQTIAGLVAGNASSRNAVVGGNAANSALTLNVAAADTFSGTIGGSGANENNVSLIKTGTGTLVLSGANTYAGGTIVSAGTLRADALRTPAAGVVTSSATGRGTVVVNGGTLAGSGGTGDVVVESGGTITAGSGGTSANTAGLLTTGAQTWAGGGTYRVKFNADANAANGVAGGAYDTMSMGLLSLQNLGGPNGKFNLVLIKSGTFVFDPAVDTTYTIASATSIELPTGGALAGLFALDARLLGVADDRFSVSAGGGTGSDLVLTYDADPRATPEPTTALLAGVGAAAVFTRRRKVARRRL